MGAPYPLTLGAYLKEDMLSAKMPSVSYCYIEDTGDGNSIHPLLDDTFYYEWSGCGFFDFEEQINSLKPGYYKVKYTYFWDQEYEEGYRVGDPYPVIDELVSFERSFLFAPWLSFKSQVISFAYDIKSLLTKNWAVEYEYKSIGYHSNRGHLPQVIWTRVFSRPDRYTGPCKISIVRYYF